MKLFVTLLLTGMLAMAFGAPGIAVSENFDESYEKCSDESLSKDVQEAYCKILDYESYKFVCELNSGYSAGACTKAEELKTTVITKMCQNESLDGAQPLACQISDGGAAATKKLLMKLLLQKLLN
ncbi:uncharacterized protein LOC135332443 [Halichondria panicea]|uniref:uncharacterized protein LOC135332443 n=1 Tax=Halichondria panicea TaxID=6063 RepID=UPI00312BA1CD